MISRVAKINSLPNPCHTGNENNVISVFCVRVFAMVTFRNAEQGGHGGYACAVARRGWHADMESCLCSLTLNMARINA